MITTLTANRWLGNTALQMKNTYSGKLIFIHRIYYIILITFDFFDHLHGRELVPAKCSVVTKYHSPKCYGNNPTAHLQSVKKKLSVIVVNVLSWRILFHVTQVSTFLDKKTIIKNRVGREYQILSNKIPIIFLSNETSIFHQNIS